MTSTPTFRSARTSSLLAAAVMATSLAGPASAGKRQPAPIVFNEAASDRAGKAATGTRAVKASAQPASDAGIDRASRRIEFRYPDQPGTYYGANGVRTTDAPDPLVFASAETAIAPFQAQSYAAAQAPQFAAPAAARDPSLTPGAFDARAAAQQVSAKRETAVVDAAPLLPVAAAAPPASAGQGFEQTGTGIVYTDDYNGLPTANGELLDQNAMMAAHPTLPVPSLVKVKNIDTGREVVVRVNDRGPFEDGAIIQVSRRAADMLGFGGAGQGNLHLQYLGPAPAEILQPKSPAPASVPKAISAAPVAAIARPGASFADPLDELFGGNGQPLQTIAAPRETAAPDAVAQPAAPGLYVQLASFSEIGNADALLRRVEDRVPVEIVPARVNGADYFRVRVGPLADRGAANSLRDQFAAEGIADGRVVSAN